MDKAVFIKELKNLFISLNQQENRYSKVWLNESEFAHFFKSAKYILSVKTKKHLDLISPEIKYIIDVLDNKFNIKNNNKFNLISVYNDDEPYHLWLVM